MRRLFCLATSKFTIYWDRVRDRDHAILARSLPVLGRLQILNVASTVQVLETTNRADVPIELLRIWNTQVDRHCTNRPIINSSPVPRTRVTPFRFAIGIRLSNSP